MEIYTLVPVWVAIIAAGIVGCLAAAATAQAYAGIPFNAVGGNWRKHLWSIIFVIPVPLLLGLGSLGTLIAFLWLAIAPSVASKFHFGPKDAPWLTLSVIHGIFAIAALVVYFLVSGAL